MSGEDAWSADLYDKHARFVPELGADALAWLDPSPGERLLDLGCGDGLLTLKLVEAGAKVVGVDASADMVAKAKERGVDARLGDAAALTFEHEFDAVFSNAALHWVPEAQNVLQGVARALKPGGRFVAEFGGFGNVAAVRTAAIAVLSKDYGIETDLSDIWYFPTPEVYEAACADAGLTVERIALIPRPTPAPAGLEAWLETLAAPVFDRLPTDQREAARVEAARLAAPALRKADGQWTVDYVRLRVQAKLTGTPT